MIKETILEVGGTDPGATLAYLRDMTSELRDMASGLGRPMIVYLLQMTVLELIDTIERDKVERQRRD